METGEARTTEADWEDYLSEEFGVPIRVLYGRSRRTPVQASRRRTTDGTPEGWQIRLHSMFGGAPPDVREALAKWLRNGRRSKRAADRLDEWIHAALAELPEERRRIQLAPKGVIHDLGPLTDALLASEFAADFGGENAPAPPSVTWGRRARSRTRGSLRLGSFEPTRRVVRIHPVLDRPEVPEWFVRYVLKHEILHSVIESVPDASGRWVHHPPAFRTRERAWPEYERAVVWERRNLGKLVRWARQG